LQRSDLVWRAGSPEWTPAEALPGWFASPPAPPVPPLPAAQPSAEEAVARVEENPLPAARGFREEFLSWLTEHPQQKPLYQFRARAGRATEVPHFALAFPLGDVLAVPGFLVFLTDNDQEPGLGQFITSVFSQLGAQQMGADLKALADLVLS